MNKGKLEYVAYLVLTIAVSVFILIGISKAANAQQQTVFVECTTGEYPDEVTWQILTCNGGILLEGIAPYLGAVVLPEYYQIAMQDSYGDGWNGAYLYIDETEYGFLSDVDWIDSIGTWPQDFKDTIIDIGCLTIGLEELNINTFKPIYYFDILGREVEPTNGFYIVSDGTLTRKIYIHR
tara:strand:+ start:4106 stop:4645 length:540 start_codon:yes stop_codon:yes gene_type:complete